MSAIKIFSNLATRPKGNYVANQSAEVYQTDDGLPAVGLKWENTSFFSKETWLGPKQARFVLARDALMIAPLCEKDAKSVARWVAFGKGERALSRGWAGGLIPIAAGAIGALAAKTSDLAGIAVLYRNEDGNLGIFEAAGPAGVIDYIVSSFLQGVVRDLAELKEAFKSGLPPNQRPLVQPEIHAFPAPPPVSTAPARLPSTLLRTP